MKKSIIAMSMVLAFAGVSFAAPGKMDEVAPGEGNEATAQIKKAPGKENPSKMDKVAPGEGNEALIKQAPGKKAPFKGAPGTVKKAE